MANIVVHPYFSPRLVEILEPDTEISIQNLINLIRDWEDSDEGMLFDYIISAAGKEDLGGGVSVGITATLNNAQILFSARTTPLDNGSGRTCDATDSLGLQLYVDDATFVSLGVDRGDIIFNATTGEMATILEVVDENTLKHLALSGYGGLGWTSGDNYVVYHNAQCNVSGGNLVALDDVGANISPILQSPNVQVVRTSSSSATLMELDAIQYASYNGGVTIDVINGVAGTAFPIGTPETPSNNMTNAHDIATQKGFTKIFIKGNLTLDDPALNLNGHIFVGEGLDRTMITIDTLANIVNCDFTNANITGVLDGGSIIRNCVIGDLGYFNGTIRDSMLEGTITLNGGSTAYLFSCASGIVGFDTPIIDMGGSGQELIMRDYHGGIKLINKTGSDKVSIDLSSGQIKFASDVTDGIIICRGIGQITEDFSKGAQIYDALVDNSQMYKPPGGILRKSV